MNKTLATSGLFAAAMTIGLFFGLPAHAEQAAQSTVYAKPTKPDTKRADFEAAVKEAGNAASRWAEKITAEARREMDPGAESNLERAPTPRGSARNVAVKVRVGAHGPAAESRRGPG